MKKWGFLDQNQSEFSFFQKKKKKTKKNLKKKLPYSSVMTAITVTFNYRYLSMKIFIMNKW